MSKELHIMVGGTGTGKSTYARKLKKELGFVVFCPDNVEEKYLDFSDDQINSIVDAELKRHLESGRSFILDGKCLIPKERIEIIKRAKSSGYKVYAHDFGKSTVVSLLRRLRNPRRFDDAFWEKVYESDQRLYKSPELEEGFERIYSPPK